ncbi:MAG: DUF1194 domain-containing protein [Alphaproteobacteria bacterium]|jgi:hypothetical protein|nr:DUF1194 domain-containing protein [Alphaproteobacteria bacterium]
MRPVLLAGLLALLTGAAAAQCRQALALGLDVSGSVDEREYRLQLDGLAGALTAPPVRARLLAQRGIPVRLAIYEWSGPRDTRLLVPWTAITGPDQLQDVLETLGATSRVPAHPGTALGTAMQTGIAMLEEQSECWKRTLDLSGDGKANAGIRPRDVPPPPPGITINGLIIGDPNAPTSEPFMELVAYYRAYVLRGPGAFVESALGFEAFEAAMQRKLLRELQAVAIGALAE